MTNPTIKDRIRSAHHAAILALFSLKDPGKLADDPDLADAVLSSLEQAVDELFWLAKLPDSVAACPAPDDDTAADVPDALMPPALDADELAWSRKRRYVVDAYIATRAAQLAPDNRRTAAQEIRKLLKAQQGGRR